MCASPLKSSAKTSLTKGDPPRGHPCTNVEQLGNLAWTFADLKSHIGEEREKRPGAGAELTAACLGAPNRRNERLI